MVRALRQDAADRGLDSVRDLPLTYTYGPPGKGQGPGKKNTFGYGKISKGSVPFLSALKLHLCLTLIRPFPFPNSRTGASAPLTTKPKRIKSEQIQPWLPQALTGTPALAPGAEPKFTSAKTSKPSKMMSMPDFSKQTAQTSASKRRELDSSLGQSYVLTSPNQFLSAMKKPAAQSSVAIPQQTAEANIPTVATNQDTVTARPASTAATTAEPIITSAEFQKSPPILQIPTSGFTFRAGALGAGEVSTHTDGVPSPATLSGFSASTGLNESIPVHPESSANHLVGLGITNISLPKAISSDQTTHLPIPGDSSKNDLLGLGVEDDAKEEGSGARELTVSSSTPRAVTLSPNGSLIDSPIIDKVNAKVILSDPDRIVDIDGRKYIALDDLRAMMENNFSLAPAGGASKATLSAAFSETTTGTRVPRNELSESLAEAFVDHAAPTGPASSESFVDETFVAGLAALAPMASTAVDTSTETTSNRKQPANPFALREPLAINDVNTSTLTLSIVDIKKGIVATESVVDPAITRRNPFSSNTEVKSKWADEAVPSSPALSVAHTTLSNTTESELAVQPLTHPIRPAPFASNHQIMSKWATEAASPPAPPPRRAARIVSAIFGDSKVIGGPPSKFAQDPPSSRQAPKNTRATGLAGRPGYLNLLEELRKNKDH